MIGYRRVTNDAELKSLDIGSTIVNRGSGVAYEIVGRTERGWPIIRRELTATNPQEWEVFDPDVGARK